MELGQTLLYILMYVYANIYMEDGYIYIWMN